MHIEMLHKGSAAQALIILVDYFSESLSHNARTIEIMPVQISKTVC